MQTSIFQKQLYVNGFSHTLHFHNIFWVKSYSRWIFTATKFVYMHMQASIWHATHSCTKSGETFILCIFVCHLVKKLLKLRYLCPSIKIQILGRKLDLIFWTCAIQISTLCWSQHYTQHQQHLYNVINDIVHSQSCRFYHK